MIPRPEKNILLQRAIRKSVLRTQKRVAFALQMSEPRLSNIIGGYVSPSEKEADGLASITGLKKEQLFPNLKAK